MQLEFLAAGANECPLLRFSRWDDGETSLLREAVEQLATGAVNSLAVHHLPFIIARGGITLTWLVDEQNHGVILPQDQLTFVAQLSTETWANNAEIIRPFESNAFGFNWLILETEVNVLLSWSGEW